MLDVLIIYTPKSQTPYNETISNSVLEIIRKIICSLGYSTLIEEYSPQSIQAVVKKFKPNLIFNMAYGYVCSSKELVEDQSDITMCLETLCENILGSPASIQKIVQDKLLCSKYLLQHGFLVPLSIDVNNDKYNNNDVVIKPRFGACHRGIHLVKLTSLIKNNIDENTLIQEYISGPEFTVSILEINDRVIVLPPLKIIFDMNEDKPLLGINTKGVGCAIDTKDSYGLCDLAKKIFLKFKMRDYARIDFRISERGPVCLDINALPNMDPERSFLPITARLAGIGYEKLIQDIVNSALLRSMAYIKGCNNEKIKVT